MQLGDREKNSIIISLALNLVFMMIFVFVWFFHTYWKYEEIEEKKESLGKIIDNTEKVTKQWISFNDFNSLKTKVKFTKTEFLDSILSKMKVWFYNDNFINKTDSDFEVFIKEKERFFFTNDNLLSFTEDELSSLDDDVEEKIRKEKSRKEKIANILPSYNPWTKVVDENLLTDFKFINYIESIFKTFDLQTNWFIWINQIVPYQKKDSKVWRNKNSIPTESKIFYIPINYKLVWTKENIINFLHYVWNVWNIEINDGDFKVINDDFLFKKRKIILYWDYNKLFWNGSKYKKWYEELPIVKDYNIYNHQIIEIDSITMREYPVGYYLKWERSKESSLVEFLKDKQKYEKLEIVVSLRFYIRGVPNYKMIEFIRTFIQSYEDTIKKVDLKISEFSKIKDLQDNWDFILLKNQFLKANDYLKSISTDIKKFKSSLSKGDNIDSLYKTILEYNLILENIKSVLWLEEKLEEEILID